MLSQGIAFGGELDCCIRSIFNIFLSIKKKSNFLDETAYRAFKEIVLKEIKRIIENGEIKVDSTEQKKILQGTWIPTKLIFLLLKNETILKQMSITQEELKKVFIATNSNVFEINNTETWPIVNVENHPIYSDALLKDEVEVLFLDKIEKHCTSFKITQDATDKSLHIYGRCSWTGKDTQQHKNELFKILDQIKYKRRYDLIKLYKTIIDAYKKETT